MIIRQAQAADHAGLTQLYRELIDKPEVQVLPERLQTLATDPQHALLVVEQDGDLLATAHLIFCADAMFGEQDYALLENVVVSTRCRSQGIGRHLFEHIDTLCRQRNCSKIMLMSASQRLDAHRFFTRQGYVGDRKLAFVKYRSQFAPSPGATAKSTAG